MPQIAQVMETWSSQVFWLLLVFGLVFFVIGRGMVPKVLDTVGLRDQQIADDLAAAQAARDAADAQEEAWRLKENANREAAHKLVAQAKTNAQSATEAKVADVQSAIDIRLAEAEAAIAASREAAAAEIENVAVEAAQDIARQIARVEVSKAAAKAAVQKAMAHG